MNKSVKLKMTQWDKKGGKYDREADMIFVKIFTLSDFKAKKMFTP